MQPRNAPDLIQSRHAWPKAWDHRSQGGEDTEGPSLLRIQLENEILGLRPFFVARDPSRLVAHWRRVDPWKPPLHLPTFPLPFVGWQA